MPAPPFASLPTATLTPVARRNSYDYSLFLEPEYAFSEDIWCMSVKRGFQAAGNHAFNASHRTLCACSLHICERTQMPGFSSPGPLHLSYGLGS